MLKKINDLFSGTPMTLISGLFLGIHFVLSLSKIRFPLNLAWISVVVSGVPLLYLSISRIIHNQGISKISSALLISIAMIAAIAIGDLFAAGEVAFIMALGAILEEKTTERAKKGLRKLIKVIPQQGRRIKNSTEEIVSIDKIQTNDVLRILPGETIPVDGKIIYGETSVDQSIMTGESFPVDKTIGDKVFCGTINCFGSIDISTTQVGQDSSLQRLIRMVQEAENNRAPMQRTADKWASYLVPLALSISVFAYLGTKNIVTAVTILVVFCPCALVLATPTAIMAAIGQATKHGVLIKSGEALEKMGKIDTFVFDKTGTITSGKLEVSDIISFSPNISKNTLLSLAASAESRSEHPLGKAIVAYGTSLGISLQESTAFEMKGGKGIYAQVDGQHLICGNKKFLIESGVRIPDEAITTLENLQKQGKASVSIAMNKLFIGAIALSDVLRPTAKIMVSKLSSMSMQITLLTGDNHQTANYFGNQAGIKSIKAELLPEEKVKAISDLKANGYNVAMVGDGTNDAPALKTAHVGIAMGGIGSDITVNAADIALISDDISKIPYLKRLSNATIGTIRFSISLSLFINAVAIILSLMEILTPTTGALVHNAGSFLVVLIAAFLYDRKFE